MKYLSRSTIKLKVKTLRPIILSLGPDSISTKKVPLRLDSNKVAPGAKIIPTPLLKIYLYL